MQIANQCEYLGGWAVSYARDLLPLCYKDNFIERTFDDCISNQREKSNQNIDESIINILPNPTSQFLEISYQGVEKLNSVINYKILDIYGSTIIEYKSVNNFNKIDVSSLSSGIYTINANILGKNIIKRFVKI